MPGPYQEPSAQRAAVHVFASRPADRGPTISFAHADRFRPFEIKPQEPGPATYDPAKAFAKLKTRPAVTFGRGKTFEHPPATEEAPLMEWRGFGFGCSIEEHTLYGQCLDGLCSKRHPIEYRHALLYQLAANKIGRTGKLHDTVSLTSSVKPPPARSTALHFAAAYDDVHLLGHLMTTCHADPEARDALGQTPLATAASVGKEAAIRRLLEGGACIDTRDSLGRTPLYLAAKGGHAAAFWFLLNEGHADPHIPDFYRQRPLDVVCSSAPAAMRHALALRADVMQTADAVSDVRNRRKVLAVRKKEYELAAAREELKRSQKKKDSLGSSMSRVDKTAQVT